MSFLVVYFLKIDEVEVISHVWRTSKGKCKWPPCLDRLQVKKYMLQHKAPESDWKEYRVVVMGKYDNYALAKKKVQQALEMSSVDSDDSDLDTRTKERRERIKRKYSSSDNSEDEPRNSPAPVILNVVPSIRHEVKQEENSVVAGEELNSSTDLEANTTHASNDELEANITPLQRHILAKLDEMIGLQRQNNMLLQRILGTENRGYVPEVAKPKLPIDNDEELELWESFLEDSENFSSCVTFFGHRVGIDLKHSTRGLLGIFLTNKYATEYNWAGREPKKPFRNLKLMTLILCTLQSNGFQDVPSLIIENVVKEWLKHASSRINRGSERRRDVIRSFNVLNNTH